MNAILGILLRLCREVVHIYAALQKVFVAVLRLGLLIILGGTISGCSREPPTTFEATLGSRDVIESAVITLEGEAGEIEIEPKEGKASKGKVAVVKREEMHFVLTLTWENGAVGQMVFLRRPYSLDTGWICNQCHDRAKTGAPVDLPNMWKGSHG